MPKELALRFMVTSGDRDPTNQSFKRTVRSHAASVSRTQRSNRRPVRTRYDGEGVISFDDDPGCFSAAQIHEAQPAAACIGQSTISLAPRECSNHIQSIPDGHSDHGREPSDADILQPQSLTRLHTDYLSGNDFSPLQHLATYHAPYLPGVLNHYIYKLTIPIPELDGSTTVPLFRTAWLPVVLNDPVVFQVIILFAATHYASIAHPSQYKHLRLELLTLKQSALLALIEIVQGEQNNVLPQSSTDQSRDSRDALIAGAAKMASYEAIFGSKEAFHLHMSTVKRLLRSHGGLNALGMKGFLTRLLSFVDTNSASLLGTTPYLVEFGLSDAKPQSRSSGKEWYHHVPLQFRGNIRSTKSINLEAFLGLVTVDINGVERRKSRDS